MTTPQTIDTTKQGSYQVNGNSSVLKPLTDGYYTIGGTNLFQITPTTIDTVVAQPISGTTITNLYNGDIVEVRGKQFEIKNNVLTEVDKNQAPADIGNIPNEADKIARSNDGRTFVSYQKPDGKYDWRLATASEVMKDRGYTPDDLAPILEDADALLALKANGYTEKDIDYVVKLKGSAADLEAKKAKTSLDQEKAKDLQVTRWGTLGKEIGGVIMESLKAVLAFKEMALKSRIVDIQENKIKAEEEIQREALAVTDRQGERASKVQMQKQQLDSADKRYQTSKAAELKKDENKSSQLAQLFRARRTYGRAVA